MTSAAHTEILARERDLAQRCAAGERAAQESVFALLRIPIHRTLHRILGPSRHAMDLTQDAFLEVFRSIGSFRGESRLASWAEIVAARVAYRHLSSRPPRPTHLSLVPEPVDPGPGPDRTTDAREAIRRLYAILDRLEPKYRVTYALHVIDGRPLQEVARTTETTYVAAKNRAARARRMVNERARRDPLLRRFLERGGETP